MSTPAKKETSRCKEPKRQKFTKEEDEQLAKLVKKFGTSDWLKISKEMKTKSARQCRERWTNCKSKIQILETDSDELKEIKVVALLQKEGGQSIKIKDLLNFKKDDVDADFLDFGKMMNIDIFENDGNAVTSTINENLCSKIDIFSVRHC